jgi:hypothetical protein
MDSHTAPKVPKDQSPWLMFQHPIYRLLLSLRPVSSISSWHIIVEDPRDQRSLLVFAFDAMPYSDEKNEMSTLLICYGAVVISAFYDGQEYVPPRTPTLEFSGLEGIEAPNLETVRNLRQLAVEVVNECLKKMPVCQEVVHPEAPKAAPLHRVPSFLEFVQFMPFMQEIQEIQEECYPSTEIAPLVSSPKETHPHSVKRRRLDDGKPPPNSNSGPRPRMSASHNLKVLPTPAFFALIAPTDSMPILPPPIFPVGSGPQKQIRQAKAWLGAYLLINPLTDEVMGMHEFVKGATVNQAMCVADEMVPLSVQVTEIGPPKSVSLVVCGPDGKCSPSEYSLKHLSGNQQYNKFEADLTSLVRTMMAIYARSIGDLLEKENRLKLSKTEIVHASIFLNRITTGVCNFARQHYPQRAPTTTKGGFVEEAGKLVYEIGERSKTDGPHSKERGMMDNSFGYWVLKTVLESFFFGVDAHRGLDGMKNLSGRMATALQREEAQLGGALFGTPYEKAHFYVETSFIEKFIESTDDNKRTATSDWKLYGKLFWTLVLKVCAARKKDIFLLYNK